MVNFETKRLTRNAINEYLLRKFNEKPYKLIDSSSIFGFINSIYKDNDKSINVDSYLFSMAQLLHQYTKRPVSHIYTFLNTQLNNLPLTNKTNNLQKITKTLLDIGLANYGSKRETTFRQFREEGFSYDYLKKLIKDRRPVMLTLLGDGRDYYSRHSVVVVGYVHYQCNDGKEGKLLKVADGIMENDMAYGYIDYDLIDRVSFINFIYN